MERKEAMKILKDFHDKSALFSVRTALDTVFPEFVESEDERIRKGLIKAFGSIGKKEWGGINVKNAIAWIEKQGEHANFINKIQIGDKVTRNEDGVLVNLSQLKRVAKKDEKQNEQKPDNIDNKFISMRETKPKDISEFLDRLTTVEQEFLWEHIAKIRKLDKEEQKSTGKVKPRFKFGNWVVIDSEVLYIKEVTEDGYLTDEGGIIPFRCDKEAHLWTIQDAKDGDVLYLQKDGKEHIIIYKGVLKERFRTFVSAYCAYNGIVDDFCFADVNRYVDIAYGGIMPATKEQREALIKAMTNAGYTFDFEKKELKKIEKPAGWSEEDEENLKWFEKFFRAESVIAEGKDIPQDRYLWFKNLKGRVQPKQEWSEDTQQWIDVIIKDYEDLHDANKDHRATIQAKINILKSLRPQSQWKPSNEQLYTLEKATHIVGSKYKSCLTSLYNDLKKLRGE